MYKLLLCLIVFWGATLHVKAQDQTGEECATVTTDDPYFDRDDYEKFKQNFLL
jgi:hypothetical protein